MRERGATSGELYVRPRIAVIGIRSGGVALTTAINRGTKGTMDAALQTVVVGSYADADEAGIHFFAWDADSGTLTPDGTVTGVTNPSYLLPHPTRDRIYAVGETTDYEGRAGGSVAVLARDDSGQWSVVQEVFSGGGAPCHLGLAAAERGLLVANYMGGNVAIIPLTPNGDFAEEAQSVRQHQGSGPHVQRQEAAHAHCFLAGPMGAIAYTADLGCDAVFAYEVAASGDRLTPLTGLTYRARPGAGPRHLTFSSDGRFGYLLNELNSTIDVLTVSPAGGLACRQTIPMLPPDWSGHSTAAEVLIHPHGRWLYASNRGHDSLAVYAIGADEGHLTLVGHVPTQGEEPRNFRISPDGRHLIAANQRTHTLVVFRVDEATGRLSAIGDAIDVPRPTCVQFLR